MGISKEWYRKILEAREDREWEQVEDAVATARKWSLNSRMDYDTEDAINPAFQHRSSFDFRYRGSVASLNKTCHCGERAVAWIHWEYCCPMCDIDDLFFCHDHLADWNGWDYERED